MTDRDVPTFHPPSGDDSEGIPAPAAAPTPTRSVDAAGSGGYQNTCHPNFTDNSPDDWIITWGETLIAPKLPANGPYSADKAKRNAEAIERIYALYGACDRLPPGHCGPEGDEEPGCTRCGYVLPCPGPAECVYFEGEEYVGPPSSKNPPEKAKSRFSARKILGAKFK